MADQIPKMTFNEALAFFLNKINLATATWRDIWTAQHDRAFVVAGAADAQLLQDFRDAIEEAIRDGTGYAAFREKFDDIVTRHGWSYNGSPGWRSRVIYKTNMRTAYQAGRFQQQKAIADRRPYWRYRHSHFVQDPRPQHLAWDGLVLRHDNPWWDAHYPPNGWGCFPGWLPARCDARVGLKTQYAGKMVELHTRFGHRFTATANHPVLTGRGWLAAQQLEKGDQVIGACGDDQAVTRGIVEDQKAPARAEDLFEALAAQGLRICPMSSHDFHGDAALRKSEIHIAGSDRALMDVFEAARGKLIGEAGFEEALHSRIESAGIALRPAQAATIIRDAIAPEDFSNRGLRQSDAAGDLGLAAQAVAIQGQHLPLDLVVAGIGRAPGGAEEHLRFAPGLHADPALAGSIAPPAPSYATSIQDASQRAAVDAELFGQLLERNSGSVAPDEVVFIRKFDWSGHVYDFSTRTGLILAGGIVVSNCQCRVESLSQRDVERLGVTVRDRGPDTAIDPKTGAPVGIDEGWDYTPGRSVTDDRGRLVQQLSGGLKGQLKSLFLTSIADLPDPPDPPVDAGGQ